MRRKILVADDSLTIQKVIRLALSNEGYEIQAVSNGEDATQQIPLYRPDVILVDVSLPGKSAFTLKEEYDGGEDRRELKFVLMSSAFEEIDEKKVEKLKFHGRLIKPFDPAHLRKVISSVLEGVPAQSTKDITAAPTTRPKPSAPAAPPPARLKPMVPPKSPPPMTQKPKMKEDLWESKVTTTDEPPTGSLPKTDTSQTDGEEDIRKLTEDTIKMSGLDNYDWNVNDDAIKSTGGDPGDGSRPTLVSEETLSGMRVEEPTLAPTSNMTDTGGSTFPMESGQSGGTITTASPPAGSDFFDRSSSDLDIPTEAVEAGSHDSFATEDVTTDTAITPGEATQIVTLEPTSPNIDIAHAPSFQAEAPDSLHLEEQPIAAPPPVTEPQRTASGIEGHDPNVMPLNTVQMEEIIRRQMRETMERIARETLPDIAEKVIKEEINKMLREQP